MAWIAPVAIGAASLISGWISQHKQNKENRRVAADQNAVNESMLQQQLAYNTPASQMARYKDAGLNPNLVYSQGNPGNQAQPLSASDRKPVDYQGHGSVNAAVEQMLPLYNQSIMARSQVQATNAKTRQTYAMTALNKLQTQVLAKNPLLDDDGFKAIIDGLKSTAEIKGSESGIRASQLEVQLNTANHQVNKVFREVELLDQKFKLSSQDSGIKAEVLKSKEFQNSILEVQKRFLADGDVGPQQIMQFIQLLLMKIL